MITLRRLIAAALALAPLVISTAASAAPVKIHDRTVFDVLAPRAGKTPEARAAAAARVLERLAEEREEVEVKVEDEGDISIVHGVVNGGKTPIIQVSADDAAAVSDASARVHADAIAGKVRVAIKAERQRAAIARPVFAFSLLVFSALIALLLFRKVGELVERLRAWVNANPDRLPALRVRGIEVVQPAAVRGGLGVALGGLSFIGRVAVLYTWVLVALSLFEVTRGYSERLTGFVLTPVYALVTRVAGALPVLVIGLVTMAALGVSLRFVRLFFGSVARGETTVGWMPRDLAAPTSLLVRSGMVITTLVVAAPLITGADDGALSRAGVIALVALGLASTPVLACAAAGIAVVFGRRLRLGDRVIVGDQEGVVRALTLLEVVLEGEGSRVHVPHMVSLWRPTIVLGPAASVSVEMSLDARSDVTRVIAIATEAAATMGSKPIVTVLSLDAYGLAIKVAVTPWSGSGVNELVAALAAAFAREGIALGRRLRSA